jgi:hypothetical protein
MAVIVQIVVCGLFYFMTGNIIVDWVVPPCSIAGGCFFVSTYKAALCYSPEEHNLKQESMF